MKRSRTSYCVPHSVTLCTYTLLLTATSTLIDSAGQLLIFVSYINAFGTIAAVSLLGLWAKAVGLGGGCIEAEGPRAGVELWGGGQRTPPARGSGGAL